MLTHEQTWVTVSPKIGMKGGLPVLVSALERANEIKHPVATEHHIESWMPCWPPPGCAPM